MEIFLDDKVPIACYKSTVIDRGRHVFGRAGLPISEGRKSSVRGETMSHVTSLIAALAIFGSATAAYSTTVATPTLSDVSGALTPGTAVTASDSTSGSTIFYTVDGTTPAYATNVRNGLSYPTGTSMVYRPTDYPSGFLIYGAKTIKLVAAKSGMTDSAVASYAYTLTSPTGTALSSCGTLAAGTSYYLSSNVSASGSCMISGGSGWTLNLNGHTITYGASSTPLVSSVAAVTNSTATVTCSSCSFTSGLVNKEVSIDDGGQTYDQTMVATYVNATTITLASAPAWSGSGNNLHIWPGSAVYEIDCDASTNSGCKTAKIYNGTITQTSTINPDSSAVHIGATSN
jgi:hypothetical protein